MKKKACNTTMDLFSRDRNGGCDNTTQIGRSRIISIHEIRQNKNKTNDNDRSLIMGAFVAHAKKLGW